MFGFECLLYFLIVLYSLFYQLYCLLLYEKNKKIDIEDASGLFVSKDVLNKNDLASLYVTEMRGKHNDHYDIARNVIRLSKEVYDSCNLASMSIALNQVTKAIVFSKSDRSKEKVKALILDWSNKIFFILFIIAAYSKALDLMSLSLVVMFVIIFIKYNDIVKRAKVLEDNINYVKKEYKLNQHECELLQKTTTCA